ncbi:MAG: hypothetical protein JNM25_00760 [Planctomycetes bacterium]|nr:hypothetical protein [Planctomycetota bacterium]
MRRRKQRKGATPGAAVGLLVVCAAIAAFSLHGQFGGGSGPVAPADESMPDADVDGGDPPDDAMAPTIDLLLRHGSWSGKEPVRMAFVSAVDAAVAAAPIGETAPAAASRWVGADPPTMHLGVLMIGDTVRRAVVDGRVVGLGDTVGKALIVAIDRDTVTTTWGGKRLTYDLDGDQPREFRAELRRRGTEPNQASGAGANDKSQESK